MNRFSVIPSEAKRSRGIPLKNAVVTPRDLSTALGMTGKRMLSVFCILSFATASLIHAQTESEFAKANQEYAQAHFKEAIADYEALVRAGQWNANLFYDLGNAYFRTRDFGRAILNYERALALDQRHPEATANLQIARDESRALVSLSILCLLVCAMTVWAIHTLDNGSKGRALAIVTGTDVQARLATADTANSVLALPAGSEIKILNTRGDWMYAALPNDLRGWIQTKNAEP